MIAEVTAIDISVVTDITFIYQDRLTVHMRAKIRRSTSWIFFRDIE